MHQGDTASTAEIVERYKLSVLEGLEKKGDSIVLSEPELAFIANAWTNGTPSYVCAAVLSCERFYARVTNTGTSS